LSRFHKGRFHKGTFLIDDAFPFVPESDVFLAVSEIFVHMEILVNEGRAVLADPGPPALY